MVLVAVLTVLYTVLAGMLSVVYTDVVNGVIMLLGVGFSLAYMVVLVGGPGEVRAAAAAGYRASAVDHVGMGPSDRPSELDDYTVQRHVDWLHAALFDGLDLQDLVFVLQDWGGILGRR